MEKIKISDENPSSDNSNNLKNINSKIFNSIFKEQNDKIYFKKYKLYKFFTFFLIFLIVPSWLISIKIISRIAIRKYKISKDNKFNYLNRKINLNYHYESNKDNLKLFNISSNYIPKLPENKEEHYIKKEYYKTKYNSTNLRYHFEDLYENRKIFLIDYSDNPYQQINKSKSFEENANKIFLTSGMLNITKLNIYYKNINFDTHDLNHIHLSMSFDHDYILLSTISIASILNTSNSDTYIHFHIVLINCTYEDIKLIIELEKINPQVSFIFYNGKQAEYDFKRGSDECRGIGEYARFLIPEIVNNTNKILILDSGDIMAVKDLSEIYFYELGDNYCAFSLEDVAGRFLEDIIIGRNNFYPNGGVTLINIRKYRKDKLYKSAFYSTFAYEILQCPYQDILLLISNYKFKIFPINFNCPQLYDNKDLFNKNGFNSIEISRWMETQNLSLFKYSREELINAALNPIILHLYHSKPYNDYANEEYKNMWINYCKMTGLLEKIKKKYPKPFMNNNKSR